MEIKTLIVIGICVLILVPMIAAKNVVYNQRCDFNEDGMVNFDDCVLFIEDWGRTDCSTEVCESDLNDDGVMDMQDWLIFGKSYGSKAK